jgi:antirestriction protein ArdC
MGFSTVQIQQEMTEKIIAKLKEGIVPWRKPWVNDKNCQGLPVNVLSKKTYRGINVILLNLAALNGFPSKYWGTYKQWQEKKCQVQKGQKSSTIVFWNMIKTTKVVNGESVLATFPMLKVYSVFNVGQVTGDFAAQFMPKSENGLEVSNSDFQKAIEIIKNCNIVVNHGGNSAHFSPSNKEITMPSFDSFQEPSAYYATLFHEITHYFDDKMGNDKDNYAYNELVAEMSSVMVCAQLNIPYQIDNHISYINSWIKTFQNDYKVLMQAAKRAALIVNQIIGEESNENEVENEVENEEEKAAA